jgi:tRNA modification GTPase
MNLQDTIVALATASGSGALSIIRISGTESIDIASKIFRGSDLKSQFTHTIHYGHIVDGIEIVDEVMVSIFRAPRSFTTEDSVEISCHGSMYIVQKIIQLIVSKGARIATPGEFTQRAFIHGRLDLSQAEAVADLIASQSQSSKDIAIHQMRGGISTDLKSLRGELLNFTSLIELELDFGEEDVEFANRDMVIDLLNRLKTHITPLIESFKYGNAIKNGVPVAIIGKPNVGKSTLLNALLKENRAIVSEIAGTTRDSIEEVMVIDGIEFRFIDTAGIRETEDVIEKIGVERSMETILKAQIVIYMLDFLNPIPESDVADFQSEMMVNNPTLEIVTVMNKCDIESPSTQPATLNPHLIFISAKEEKNISSLKDKLVSIINQFKSQTDSATITNLRHYEALQKSLDSIDKTIVAFHSKLSGELLSFELKAALYHLGEITGEVTNDEVLGNIFSKFCIGK